MTLWKDFGPEDYFRLNYWIGIGVDTCFVFSWRGNHYIFSVGLKFKNYDKVFVLYERVYGFLGVCCG